MRKRRPMDSPEMPIAPMIDCVFLMLVYFMTTSSLEKSEADLAFPLAQAGMAADPLPAVDEQLLRVSGAGEVHWNGSVFVVLAGPADLSRLGRRLEAFKLTCRDAGSEPSLRVEPHADAPHQAIVCLLDVVENSGIEKLHFP